MTDDPAIWTLNARGTALLDVVASYFNMSDTAMGVEIRSAHKELVQVLETKGVDYGTLRSALTPQADRLERGFIFDTAAIQSHWYGRDVAERLVPLLPRDTSCSFLVGDLISENQVAALDTLRNHLQARRSYKVVDTSQLFCVYINNLTETMGRRLSEGLQSYEPYLGHVDVTLSSPMKSWLSATLVNEYLKARQTFVCGHEDDVPNSEDSDLPLWPLEENGYGVRSVQETYFDLFLSYKIERAVFPGFESDTRFGLSAISEDPADLASFAVEVEEAKADYMRSEKGGSLKRAGLQEMAIPELERLIRSKISSNYIYYLRFKAEFGVSLFNILLEIPHLVDGTVVKFTAAMAYEPERKTLRVVTFY